MLRYFTGICDPNKSRAQHHRSLLEVEVSQLFNCVNSLHPTIKFTMDYSATEINFLGVTVTKVGNKLKTDL